MSTNLRPQGWGGEKDPKIKHVTKRETNILALKIEETEHLPRTAQKPKSQACRQLLKS